MIDARSDLLFNEAEKHIEQMCASLTDLAHLFGYRVEDGCLQDRLHDIFTEAYRDYAEPIFNREQRELELRQSGEAAKENKADDEHDRMWYARLMQSSKELRDE